MPGNAKMLQHTSISKPFTSCDSQTYHSIWANEYWILLSSAGGTQKTSLVTKEWLFCAAWWQLGVWRDLCAPNIKKKKAPELYGENHRLENFGTVISSLGPICFPYSLGQVVSVFCFFPFPLSLHGLVYFYCRFSNTWNYSWDSTTE